MILKANLRAFWCAVLYYHNFVWFIVQQYCILKFTQVITMVLVWRTRIVVCFYSLLYIIFVDCIWWKKQERMIESIIHAHWWYYLLFCMAFWIYNCHNVYTFIHQIMNETKHSSKISLPLLIYTAFEDKQIWILLVNSLVLMCIVRF